MMLYSELASRYGNALYELAAESGAQDKVIKDIRSLNELFHQDNEVLNFLVSPLIKPSDKETVLNKACTGGGLDNTVLNFILMLAKKNRLSIFTEIVRAYEAKSDDVNGVTRGDVVSSCVLTPEERKEIESKVEAVTKKRVILTYHEDPEHIGGLVANVGSYTFDDTLTSHLKRLQDDLKRRAH